jgi:hypothetical protein
MDLEIIAANKGAKEAI